MGKDLKGRDLGVVIYQRQDGLYSARYTNKLGKRKEKYFKKLQECRQWLADAILISMRRLFIFKEVWNANAFCYCKRKSLRG